MITCKTCHKFAKYESTIINGIDEIKLIGSCKRCGYISEPKTIDENGNKLSFSEIGKSRIDCDFVELGASPEYPYGGYAVEPYDIEREKELCE